MSVARDTTGGLRWHWRAFWRRGPWRETSAAIAGWLDTTQPRSGHLLLIGGSAGWMMSGRWLQRFSRVDLIDIDPYAPRLFRFNHGRALRTSGTELNFVVTDGLADLPGLLRRHPDASLFFDNVLGQHLYRTGNIGRAEADLARIKRQLEGRDWGSVHDLFSGPADPKARPAAPEALIEATAAEQGLVAAGLRGLSLQRHLLAQVGGVPQWMDHLTSNLFPTGTRSQLIAWPFQPGYAHWLQAGWVSPRH